jgi:hypothetical protein
VPYRHRETKRDVSTFARPHGALRPFRDNGHGLASDATPSGQDPAMTITPVLRPVDDAPRPVHVFGTGPVVEEWWCPVCSAPVHRIGHRSGRPRIYCTNACRQRAFRWRRDHHARLAATPEHPAERASVGIRGHALRSARDFVSTHSDSHGREVTVCGAMGRPARLGRFTHTRFVADNTSYSCRSCIRLIAIPNDTMDSDWPPPPAGRWDRWLNGRRP